MIRQGTISANNLAAASVETAKLAAQAVTIEKTDEPVWSYAVESNPFFDVSLTTTPQECTSVDIAVPSWVGNLTVFAIANAQMRNTSGGDQGLVVSCRINDNDDGGRLTTAANNTTVSLHHVEAFSVAAPGSTIQASVYAWVASSTNSDNSGAVWAICLGTR